MFEIDPPTDKGSITESLERLDDQIHRYFKKLAADELLAPQGSAWSPAGHLQHLRKSVVPVARAMRLPRPLLAVLFGRARRSSISFAAVRGRYHEALDGGLQAGRFGPPEQRFPPPAETYRRRILWRWRLAGVELRKALDRWPDADLDRYLLPHPGLGKLTVREMLFFTVYHNAHHARRVHERRAHGAVR